MEKNAEHRGIPVRGLETTEDTKAAMFLCMLEDAANAENGQEEQCRQWMHYFLSKNEGEEKDFFHKCFLEKGTQIPVQINEKIFLIDRKILLRNFFYRNEKMTDGIFREIQNKEFPFVAIGLGHCLGKKGVPHLLETKYGLKVKKVTETSQIHIPRDKVQYDKFD